jgi:hydroxymethylbilane synthase
MRVRLGTRASGLARAQSGLVLDYLMETISNHGIDLDVAVVPVTAEGDSRHERSTEQDSGVYVAALRVALLSGECDIVVHAMEDVPLEVHPDLIVAAVPRRGEVRDAACTGGWIVADLPLGARIAVDSGRRAAQVRALRSDFVVIEADGSIDFQFETLNGGDYEGLVVGKANLDLLGRTHSAVQVFETNDLLPAPGQGAFAVEVLASAPQPLHEAITAIDDPATRAAVTAERAVMAGLCAPMSAPVGTYATVTGDSLNLHVRVLNRAGSLALNDYSNATPADAETLGRNAALSLLGRGAGRLIQT